MTFQHQVLVYAAIAGVLSACGPGETGSDTPRGTSASTGDGVPETGSCAAHMDPGVATDSTVCPGYTGFGDVGMVRVYLDDGSDPDLTDGGAHLTTRQVGTTTVVETEYWWSYTDGSEKTAVICEVFACNDAAAELVERESWMEWTGPEESGWLRRTRHYTDPQVVMTHGFGPDERWEDTWSYDDTEEGSERAYDEESWVGTDRVSGGESIGVDVTAGSFEAVPIEKFTMMSDHGTLTSWQVADGVGKLALGGFPLASVE